jgi:hypothetical protein
MKESARYTRRDGDLRRDEDRRRGRGRRDNRLLLRLRKGMYLHSSLFL